MLQVVHSWCVVSDKPGAVSGLGVPECCCIGAAHAEIKKVFQYLPVEEGFRTVFPCCLLGCYGHFLHEFLVPSLPLKIVRVILLNTIKSGHSFTQNFLVPLSLIPSLSQILMVIGSGLCLSCPSCDLKSCLLALPPTSGPLTSMLLPLTST